MTWEKTKAGVNEVDITRICMLGNVIWKINAVVTVYQILIKKTFSAIAFIK